MTPKDNLAGSPQVQKPPFSNGQSRPSKTDHSNPVPLEDFDRERLGVAAKE